MPEKRALSGGLMPAGGVVEKRPRVLVVEDEAIIAEDLRLQLEGAGYEVVAVAASGEEALSLARACEPALVFMDINLRGELDGVEVACLLRKAVDSALVFMTAFSDAGTLERAKAAAPEGYLLKPYNRRELVAAATMAVEKRRLEVEVRRSHARFRAAMQASPDPIARARRDGSLVDSEGGPRDLAGFVPEAVRERALECVRRCLESARLERMEYSAASAEGTLRHYELRVAPVDIDECLLVLRDVTQQRDALQRAGESMRLLHSLARKLQAAREEERKEISREIHDSLGQHLVALKMQLSSCVAALPGALPAGVRERFDSLGASADAVVDEIRRITTKLRPLILDDLGLVAGLKWLCADFEKRTRVLCRFHGDEELVVESGRATALFRIVQEALTNAVRHGGAGFVAVSLRAEAGSVLLSVRDNGRGMDTPEEASRAGYGLTTIRERAALWGGEAVLTSHPGKGTALTVRLPMSDAGQAPQAAL